MKPSLVILLVAGGMVGGFVAGAAWQRRSFFPAGLMGTTRENREYVTPDAPSALFESGKLSSMPLLTEAESLVRKPLHYITVEPGDRVMVIGSIKRSPPQLLYEGGLPVDMVDPVLAKADLGHKRAVVIGLTGANELESRWYKDREKRAIGRPGHQLSTYLVRFIDSPVSGLYCHLPTDAMAQLTLLEAAKPEDPPVERRAPAR